MQNLSHQNEFDLRENESVGETHFHMNGGTRQLGNGLLLECFPINTLSNDTCWASFAAKESSINRPKHPNNIPEPNPPDIFGFFRRTTIWISGQFLCFD